VENLSPNNLILASLSQSNRAKLPPLERVILRQGTVLSEPDLEIEYVYFLDDVLVSILSLNQEGGTLEIGLVGYEGVIGISAILGGVSPYRAVVQKTGRAFRMKRCHIEDEFRRNPALQQLLLRYTNALLTQIAQYSICNCYHTLQERFCRWLLVARDCARSDTLPMTQEWIARLLGVRRASVTVAAGLLQKAGLIRTGRGEIVIIDPAGLQSLACECYSVLQKSLHRLTD
jgi:CRP-like cAMP-binding protein